MAGNDFTLTPRHYKHRLTLQLPLTCSVCQKPTTAGEKVHTHNNRTNKTNKIYHNNCWRQLQQ